jgi:hypothetical protein
MNEERRDQILHYICSIYILLISILFFCPYLSFDSSDYAYLIITGNNHFHPHHLLFVPFMTFLLSPFTLFTYDNFLLMTIMQCSMLVISLCGVFLFYRISIEFRLSSANSILLTTIFATSNTWLRYSTECEVYNIACTCILFSLYMNTILIRSQKYRYSLLCGVGYLAAMTMHQTAIFWCGSLIVSIVQHRRKISVLKRSIFEIILPIFFIVFLYRIISYQLGYTTMNQFFHWVTSYAHVGRWGGPISFDNVYYAISGYLNVLFSLRKFIFVLFIFVLLYIFLSQKNRMASLQSWIRSPLVWMLLGSTVPLCLFAFWWHPADVEFWIIPFPFTLWLIHQALNKTSLYLLISIILISNLVYFDHQMMKWKNRSYLLTQFESIEPMDCMIVEESYGYPQLKLWYYVKRKNALQFINVSPKQPISISSKLQEMHNQGHQIYIVKHRIYEPIQLIPISTSQFDKINQYH